MTESRESRTEPTTVTGDRRAYETPPYDDRPNRLNSILMWVAIVAGVVFIVAVIFFSGFFIGRSSYGNFRGGYHQPGMMGPSQTGPYGQWPDMMGPGGMMGPNSPWPGQQPTTTTAPTTPRP